MNRRLEAYDLGALVYEQNMSYASSAQSAAQ